MKSEEFKDAVSILHGVSIRIMTYKIGDEFHCHVSSADPGATIARASSTSKDTALDVAVKKATQRLSPKK